MTFLTRTWQKLPIRSILFKTVRLSSQAAANDTFLSGDAAMYIEEMYKQWKKDPNSVHASWNIYFSNVEKGIASVPPPHLGLTKHEVPLTTYLEMAKKAAPAATAAAAAATTTAAAKPTTAAAPAPAVPVGPVIPVEITKEIKVALAAQKLIKSYRNKGFLGANLDPLGLGYTPVKTNAPPDGIEKFSELDGQDGTKIELPTAIGGGDKSLPLKDLVERLKKIYCGTVGIQYNHNHNSNQRNWLRDKVEAENAFNVSKDEQKIVCKRLLETGAFEAYMARNWPKETRLGIDGCDALIPLIKSIIDKGCAAGIDTFVLGLCQRGRLNVIANICKKPLKQIFSHFYDYQPDDGSCTDIIHNLGMITELTNNATKKKIKLIITSSPSHVEICSPKTLGRTKSEQFLLGSDGVAKVMAILVHGDASFAGHGCSYEAMQLSEVDGCSVGGSVHIILSNQIGYTTLPHDSRSCNFSSDIGPVMLNAPVIHLNAEDPEKVVPIAKLAVDWRTQFKKDFVVDLIGYKRYGDQPFDDPTQANPTMYNKINKMEPIWQSYAKKLVEANVISKDEVKKYLEDYEAVCEKNLQEIQQEKRIIYKEFVETTWGASFKGKDPLKFAPTGIKEDIIQKIATAFAAGPPKDLNFVLHKGIERTYNGRQDLVKKRQADWSIGEALSWGSLLLDGVSVRLTGQDSDRGTFAHRHHIIYNQKDAATYYPMRHLDSKQAAYNVVKSVLSELGVLAYEIGYTLPNPNSLTLWEAQFGDFATTAQVVIDQLMCSGERKWSRQSNMIMLLPHGMEGMGPEHSCCKPERYLQMAGDDHEVIPEFTPDFAARQLKDCSFILANCSIPGNYFHIIRRQIAMPFRKPLVLLTPKSLLRLPEARSSFDEMLEGTEFRRILPDDGPASKDPGNVKRLIFCTGRVFFEIQALREKQKKQAVVALTRVEQLFPFPYDLIKAECDKYPNAEVVWEQEEHKNQGFWDYFVERYDSLMKYNRPLKYIGRPASCCPASGIANNHSREIKEFHAKTLEGV